MMEFEDIRGIVRVGIFDDVITRVNIARAIRDEDLIILSRRRGRIALILVFETVVMQEGDNRLPPHHMIGLDTVRVRRAADAHASRAALIVPARAAGLKDDEEIIAEMVQVHEEAELRTVGADAPL